jgi:hypothetical protein
VGRGEVTKSDRGRHNKAETGINRCRHMMMAKRRKERKRRMSFIEGASGFKA